MYVNTKYNFTNTPMNITAGYNTWPYVPPRGDWNQKTTRYYIDQYGRQQAWNSWNPPQTIQAQQQNITYHGTSSRSASFITNNTVIQ